DGIRDGHVTGVQTCALPILMYLELSGRGIISSFIPNDSTRSRSFFKPSTDHRSSNCSDGRALQILFTPNAANNLRISSEDSCWRSEERRVGKECIVRMVRGQ